MSRAREFGSNAPIFRRNEHVANVTDRQPGFRFGITRVFFVLILEQIDDVLNEVLVGLLILAVLLGATLEKPDQR